MTIDVLLYDGAVTNFLLSSKGNRRGGGEEAFLSPIG
jgi:hypothetical protein